MKTQKITREIGENSKFKWFKRTVQIGRFHKTVTVKIERKI